MTNNIIPIYYHVPKCGGTYFYDMCHALHTKLLGVDPALIHIRSKQGNLVFRLMINHPRKYIQSKSKNLMKLKQNSNYKNVYETTDKYIPEIFSNIEPKDINLIVICSAGFKCSSSIFSQIDKLDTICKPYMTVRNPFERAVSLYKYLSSKNSAHETTHHTKHIDFEKFIVTENNWVVSNIMGLDHTDNYSDMEKAIGILNNFVIRDLPSINDIIKNIYGCIHKQKSQIIDKSIKDLNPHVNKNSTNNIKDNYNFSSLSQETKLKFLKKNHLDILTYNYFARI